MCDGCELTLNSEWRFPEIRQKQTWQRKQSRSRRALHDLGHLGSSPWSHPRHREALTCDGWKDDIWKSNRLLHKFKLTVWCNLGLNPPRQEERRRHTRTRRHRDQVGNDQVALDADDQDHEGYGPLAKNTDGWVLLGHQQNYIWWNY